MIVHAVRATDILKYESLQLQGLPDRGLLVVSGPNESGKSSIGETLALGLFGRTFALGADALDKAVRWDARSGSVEVEFSTGISGRHRVVRELDRDGRREATLHTDDGAEIRGWAAVGEEIEGLLGFGFDEYLESFYLARRDVTSAQARTDAVRAMAGVLPLERIVATLAEEVPELEERSLQLADELLEVDDQLGRYSREDLLPPQPGPVRGNAELVAEAAERKRQLNAARSGFDRQLPELDAATRELVGRAAGASPQQWRDSAERMELSLDAIEESVAFLGYDDVESGTGRLSHMLERIQQGLGAFDELLTAATDRRAELAGRLGERRGQTRAVDSTFDDLQADIDGERKTWRATRTKLGRGVVIAGVLAVAAAAAGVLPLDGLTADVVLGLRIGAGVLLAGAAWLFSKQRGAVKQLRRLGLQNADLSSRRDAAEDDLKVLDGLAELQLDGAVESLQGLRDPGPLQGAVNTFRSGPGGALVKTDISERLQSGAEDQLALVNAHLGSLGERIERDVEALGRIHELRATRTSLSRRRAEAATLLETGELARELATDASRHIAFEFNGRVKQAMSRILPSLTEGRYQYLRIEEDLSVRVFSSEKQDFVAFQEISGGTQRQIALATRLALSETLADRADRGPQFLFLDEPFAYFDAARTKSTLAAMPRLSEKLPQVWIATQEPPADTEPSVALQCKVESRELRN